MKANSVLDQVHSATVDYVNQNRIADKIQKVIQQNNYLDKAIHEINKIREFVGSPANILGNPLTKHGEIAEQVEVGITNAQSILNGGSIRATFEGVGRTAPEDYLIDGIAVQSKFINGANNTLSHVLDHLKKYQSFSNDGGYYNIPKDQFEIINKIYNGNEITELNEKTINAIRTKIIEIEQSTGKPFHEVIKPSISTYGEVQQGKIHETIDNHQQNLEAENEKKIEKIEQDHKPTFKEGIKVAGIAAGISATFSLGTGLYYKYKKENKNIFNGDLTIEDWKELGLDAAKSGAIGGVSSLAIYGLTNFSGLSAPLAGAFVSASKGISSLAADFYTGNITFEEFQVNTIFLCADSAGVSLAALAGQTLIPIPIAGAIIGSLAGKFACNILFEEDKELAQKLEESLQDLTNKVDSIYQDIIHKINTDFEKISNLQQWAFNTNNNLDLVEASIQLAYAYGVEDNKIIKNEQDLENFLFN